MTQNGGVWPWQDTLGDISSHIKGCKFYRLSLTSFMELLSTEDKVSQRVMQILMLLQTAQLTHESAAYCISTVKLVFPQGDRVLMCRGTGVCKDTLWSCSRYSKSKDRPHKGFKTVRIARLCAQTPQGFLTLCLSALPHGMASSVFPQLFLPFPLTSVRKEGNEAEPIADLTHD